MNRPLATSILLMLSAWLGSPAQAQDVAAPENHSKFAVEAVRNLPATD